MSKYSPHSITSLNIILLADYYLEFSLKKIFMRMQLSFLVKYINNYVGFRY